MKIIIPDDLEGKFIEKIKESYPEIKIEILSVIKRKNFLIKFIKAYFLDSLPYTLYKRTKVFLENAKVDFLINSRSMGSKTSDAEILLASWPLDTISLKELIPRLPNLKWIHTIFTGTDHIQATGLDLKNLLITNSGNVHSKRIAEFILSLVLAVSKNIPHHLKLQQQKRWETLPSQELYNSTIGIIGLGNIGSELAKRIKALEMRVIGMDIEYRENRDIDLFVYPQQINELLSNSDFVVLCCPLTEKTRGMIKKEQLKIMKKDAYLINISRGGLIEEEALINALQTKKIKGACIDVFEDMPLPRKSPFHNLNNIIITHYSAFNSSLAKEERFSIFLKNLDLYIRNKKDTTT